MEERLSKDKNPPKPAPAPAKPKTAPDTGAKPTPSAPAAPKPAVKPKPVDEVGAILSAGASRAAVWRNAATAIQAAPILGYGQLAERTLVVQNFPQLAHLTHAHNQFLSWLLWGGLVGFGLGLVFLFANQISGNRSLAANVVSVGMVFLFFSETLLSSFNLNGFLLVYALVYYLDKQKSHQT